MRACEQGLKCIITITIIISKLARPRNTEIHLPSSFYTKHTINIKGHTPHQHTHSAGQPTASAQECAEELQPAHLSRSGRPARRHQEAPKQEQGGRLTPASLPGPVAGLVGGHGAEVVISPDPPDLAVGVHHRHHANMFFCSFCSASGPSCGPSSSSSFISPAPSGMSTEAAPVAHSRCCQQLGVGFRGDVSQRLWRAFHCCPAGLWLQ